VSEPSGRAVDGGGISRATILGAVALVLIVVLAVWYFNSFGPDQSPADTVPIVEQDPGVGTTIAP
jgi:hypothetical protein